MIKLLLVHQARMTGELLAAVLRDESDIYVTGLAQDKVEALAEVEKGHCNMVLVDIGLPEHDALRLVNLVKQTHTNVKILVMGLVNSKSAILHCVEEGVDGYVLEEESLSDLVKKLRAVHDGHFNMSPAVAAALMTRVADLKNMTKELYGISLRWADDLFTELTPREWEVLLLLEQSYSNQQIADELVITTGTVKNHVHNILSKLDVSSREQAAVLMRQLMTERQRKEMLRKMGGPQHSFLAVPVDGGTLRANGVRERAA